jgi:hypothetical protein
MVSKPTVFSQYIAKSLPLPENQILLKMNHLEAIDRDIAAGINYSEIARKIYLSYPAKAFSEKEDIQYEISNDIARYFHVPLRSVQIAGSAKTGRSFHKNKDFTPGISDLDMAIIDMHLYTDLMEYVHNFTRGYNERIHFPIQNGQSTYDEYIAYLNKGIFRPTLMPYSERRAEISSYFGLLSKAYTSLFKSISAVVYLSEAFFENKQRSAIKLHAERDIL